MFRYPFALSINPGTYSWVVVSAYLSAIKHQVERLNKITESRFHMPLASSLRVGKRGVMSLVCQNKD